jgi:hypothetical protein
VTEVLIFFGGLTTLVLALLLNSQFQALAALSVSALALYVPLYCSVKSPYYSLKALCYFTFVAQCYTVTVFFINRNNDFYGFKWEGIKPFDYSLSQTFLILSKVSLFLILVIIFFGFLFKFRLIGGSIQKRVSLKTSNLQSHCSSEPSKKVRPCKNWAYQLLIFGFLGSVISIWMFNNNIGLVGIESHRLPLKLSGFLYYFSRYFLTLLMVYIYFRTNRNFSNSLILLVYASIVGLASLSRSVFGFLAVAVIIFSWVDRRFLRLLFAILFLFAGYSEITDIRQIVYWENDGEILRNFDSSYSDILFLFLDETRSKFFDGRSFLYTLGDIFNRFDGFENLVMSNSYDTYLVLPPWAVDINIIWNGFFPVDIDLHHLQWQGEILPKGFYNGGGLLSTSVMIFNAGFIWFIFLTMEIAFILVILEKSLIRLKDNLGFQSYIKKILISLLTLSLIVNFGLAVFTLSLILLFLMSLISNRLLNSKKQ